MKIETWLPVFPGFYGTLFDCHDDVVQEETRYQLEEAGIFYSEYMSQYVDLCPRYDEWCLEVAKRCVAAVSERLPNFIGLEFQELQSPKEYNFANDSVNVIAFADIEVLRNWLLSDQVAGHEDFADWICERYTSRDGFCSSYSNDAEDWRCMVEVETLHGHILGTFLEFYMTVVEAYADYDLYNDIEFPNIDMERCIDPRCVSKVNEVLEYVTKGDHQAALYKGPQRQAKAWREIHREKLFKEAAERIELK